MSRLHPLIQDYIKENYPLFGPKKVSDKLNISESTVISYAKESGLIKSKINGIGLNIPDFKYDLNFYNRFQKVDEKLAYWIGFFWADGCLSRHSNLAIEIIKEDADALKDLFLSIFQFRVSTRKRAKKRAQTTFRICDKNVGLILENLGKYPHSSESHKKIFEYLSDKKLQISFLRGLIDGDGNFYINEKEKYAQFTLASNYEQDWSFLEEYLKDFHPHIAKDTDLTGKSSVLRITGRENILKFIKFMNYETNDIGLKRKVEHAKKVVKMYKENPPKELTKHVFQYSKEGEFIKEYKSAKEAEDATGVKKSAIGNCLCGLSNSSGGYIWKYN